MNVGGCRFCHLAVCSFKQRVGSSDVVRAYSDSDFWFSTDAFLPHSQLDIIKSVHTSLLSRLLQCAGFGKLGRATLAQLDMGSNADDHSCSPMKVGFLGHIIAGNSQVNDCCWTLLLGHFGPLPALTGHDVWCANIPFFLLIVLSALCFLQLFYSIMITRPPNARSWQICRTNE